MVPFSLPKRFLFLQGCLALCAGISGWAIPAPTGITSEAGDRSVILHWERDAGSVAARYGVYRSTNGADGPYYLIDNVARPAAGYCDLAGTVNGRTNFYYVKAVGRDWSESAPSTKVAATPHPFADDNEFLSYVQRASFDYFWYLANPDNGLVPDRSAAGSPCSIAAVGFGLTALGIGADHGWITRQESAARALETLRTFLFKPQGPGTKGVIGYKGWFYHFIDMRDGTRFGSSEVSTIDTALFLAGALYAKQYFDGSDATETLIRKEVDAIYSRVDWAFMSRDTDALALAWQPTTGFSGYGTWSGYNEAMILFCLGMGAPTNALPAASWGIWTNGYHWETDHGQSYLAFSPLFGHTFSHCWIDFRHISDAYMSAHNTTYFENSRRAVLAQVAYCSTKPHPGYEANVWGLTACDGPSGYLARGLPPEAPDDGTLAPSGPGGCIVFKPEQSVAALKTMYERYREQIWTANGFRDAFNPGKNWFDRDELGIDQGPFVLMIENYRTQRVWRLFMRNPEVQRGLQKAGFVPQPTIASNGLSLISTQ